MWSKLRVINDRPSPIKICYFMINHVLLFFVFLLTLRDKGLLVLVKSFWSSLFLSLTLFLCILYKISWNQYECFFAENLGHVLRYLIAFPCIFRQEKFIVHCDRDGRKLNLHLYFVFPSKIFNLSGNDYSELRRTQSLNVSFSPVHTRTQVPQD